MLSRKIALRYIFTKRSLNFISVITTLSIIGISVGVAALICVMSLFNGFRNLTEEQILGFDPHFRIIPISGSTLIQQDIPFDKINEIDGINSVTPSKRGRVIALEDKQVQVFNLIGIDENNASSIQKITSNILIGTFDISSDFGLPRIVLGVQLADALGVLPGDTLSVISPAILERSLRTFRASGGTKFIVSGIFQINVQQYDATTAISDLEVLNSLLMSNKNEVNHIDIRINDKSQSDKIGLSISNIVPENTKLLSWKEINRDLYQVMQFERLAAFALLSIIIIIAVFNLLASLSMTVVEKQSDIGALKAFGTSNSKIRNIFIFEGLIIGIISTFIGTTLGLSLCYAQINFKLFKLDGTKYIIDALPIIIDYSDVIIIAIFTVILALFSTIYPAKRAASVNIAKAIKSD